MGITTCRSGRHLIKSAQDKAPNGQCRKCQHETKRRYRQRVSMKLHQNDQLLRELATMAQKLKELLPEG